MTDAPDSTTSRPRTTLLVIDAQKDFHPGGSLAIGTADQDAARIAALIRASGEHCDSIVATLDTHQKLHIAHSHFWQERPAPFTIISADDIRQGKYKPRADLPEALGQMLPQFDPTVFGQAEAVYPAETQKLDLQKYVLEYATRLEANGRFQICIWPEHCLIGSAGHAVVDPVLEAFHEWSAQTGRSVEWVWKGQNILTEMYSALQADVPVSADTAWNQGLFDRLYQKNSADRLIVCGQAMSHCVNYTVRDIVKHWPADETSKIVVLEDCASAVPGFEAAAEDFRKDMVAKGVQFQKASEVFGD